MEGGRNNENKAKAYGLLQLGWSHPSSQVWNCWQVWQILGKQSRTVLSLSTPPVTCEISPVSLAPLTSLTSHAVNNRMLEGRGFLNIVVLTNPFICRLALVNGVRGGARKQRKGRWMRAQYLASQSRMSASCSLLMTSNRGLTSLLHIIYIRVCKFNITLIVIAILTDIVQCEHHPLQRFKNDRLDIRGPLEKCTVYT